MQPTTWGRERAPAAEATVAEPLRELDAVEESDGGPGLVRHGQALGLERSELCDGPRSFVLLVFVSRRCHGHRRSLSAAPSADRILNLHQLLGHTRQILQMDVGGMPQATFLKSIELLGTKVLPQIRKELEPPAPASALGGATTATFV